MPVHNNDIADIFNEFADLLEIKRANPFRIRSYRNAARTLTGQSRNISDMVREGDDLTQLPGIGKDLAAKIKEIAETGELSKLNDLKKELPDDLSKLMKIPGLGPKKIKVLFQDLGITSVKSLKKAAQGHKLRELEGFGDKTEQNILGEIERIEEEIKKHGGKERIKLFRAEQIAEKYREYLEKHKEAEKIQVAGSYRRRRETVGDLDILAVCGKETGLMDHFVGYEDVEKIISKGKTKSSVLLRAGFQVDLRVVQPESYGAALLYFTGSKDHNIAVRKIGVGKNLKINEYGVFKGDRQIAGKTESEVYKAVGLPFIEPELREDRGEIEAGQKGNLPRLVELGDIRGDLHMHTRYSDGRLTIKEMAEAARNKGYEYIAVSDHSKHLTVANGLDERRLAEQMKEIDKLNQELKDIRILKSIELDILEDGALDLPDEVLKDLDLVLCSVHYRFNLSLEKQTKRILKAMDNPYVNIICHPSGRLINERPPYEVNMEKLIKSAKERNCFMELNAHPDRLDLNDIYCKMAKKEGVKVAVSTDAHAQNDLDFMRFGVGQARRGWLETGDVLNTRSWKDLSEELGR